MGIVLLIVGVIVLIIIIRAIYLGSSNYKVLNSEGEFQYWGSYNDCIDWIKSMNSIGIPEKYTMVRSDSAF